MTNWNRNDERMPLMDNEEIEMSFGEKHGLEADGASNQNRIVLTDRRLIRFSRSGANKDMAFISLEDIQVAEVQRTFPRKRLFLRIALLWAGAGSAMAAIAFLPLAIPLATVLALVGGYHLLRYLSVSQEGTIIFHAGRDEMGISFEGDMTNQAYTFVNCFFHLKELLPSIKEVNEGEGVRPDVPQEETWLETDETETGTIVDQGDENPVGSLKESFPQEESSESQDEEGAPGQHG